MGPTRPRRLSLACLALLCMGCASAAQATPQSSRLMFRGLEPFVPNAHDRGVWAEVAHCLHDDEPAPDSIRWGKAKAIVDLGGRQLLWGVVAVVHWPEGPALTLALDHEVRHNVRVLSHEIVHVVADVPDGDWRLEACVMRDGPYALPLRPLSDEQMRLLTEAP